MSRSADEGLPPAWGPATAAARRTGRPDRVPRPYEQPVNADLSGDSVALAATRALLSIRRREEASEVLQTVVHDLGGAVVPARLAEAHPGALPIDLSLGCGEPLLVVVPELSIAALQIAHHLPRLQQDALRAAELCDLARHQAVAGAPNEDQVANHEDHP
jgi:hypothetical protein